MSPAFVNNSEESPTRSHAKKRSVAMPGSNSKAMQPNGFSLYGGRRSSVYSQKNSAKKSGSP